MIHILEVNLEVIWKYLYFRREEVNLFFERFGHLALNYINKQEEAIATIITCARGTT